MRHELPPLETATAWTAEYRHAKSERLNPGRHATCQRQNNDHPNPRKTAIEEKY